MRDSVTFRDPAISRLTNQLPSESRLADCHSRQSSPPNAHSGIQTQRHSKQNDGKIAVVLFWLQVLNNARTIFEENE
jgi:hypothetical protein